MSKRVLIVHGWGSGPKEHWFLEEKQRLEKLSFEVHVPNMPNSDFPKMPEWVKVIEDFAPDENSVLIGHSLGGTSILRYLEEADKKVDKCIFIAAPIRRLGSGFEAIDNFFESGFDWQKVKENSARFVILNQTKDPYVPVEHGQQLAKSLDANLILIEGKDHFDKIDFELLEKNIL